MRQAVLTARVDAETSEKLDEIAALTGRSRSWVAAAAVKAYVDSEAALLRDVQEALAAAFSLLCWAKARTGRSGPRLLMLS